MSTKSAPGDCQVPQRCGGNAGGGHREWRVWLMKEQMVPGTRLNKHFLVHLPPNLDTELFGWARVEPWVGSRALLPCRDAKGRQRWNKTRQEVRQPTEFLISPYAGATKKHSHTKIFLYETVTMSELTKHFKTLRNQPQVPTSSSLPCFHSTVNSTVPRAVPLSATSGRKTPRP